MNKYELKKGFSWATFESIENELLRVIEYIPLETKQYKIYSFQISDIIKNSCSQIDSIFKEISRQCDLSDYPDTEKLEKYRERVTKKDKKLSILDYADLFSNYFNLKNMEITVRKNFDSLKPFEVFTKDKSPKWWQDYNKLKHDFYDNVNLATLENALDSLSALFGLQSRIKELYLYLVYNGIFISPNIDYSDLMKYVKKEPTLNMFSVMARSKIFEHWVSHNKDTIGIQANFKSGSLQGLEEDLDAFLKEYGNEWYKKFE